MKDNVKIRSVAWALAACAACVLPRTGLGEDASVASVSKWDPKMAHEKAVTDTNGIKWIDGRYLPIEGRAFDNTTHYYQRLPSTVTTNVNGGVRGMKSHTAGMQFRFVSDANRLIFKWKNSASAMPHMPATGVSGIDIYKCEKGRWLYVKTGWPKAGGATCDLWWPPNTPCLVNLPLYNGIESFSLGIPQAATVNALGPRKSGVNRPVVFYGTSITHGGCASRPGLAFPSIVGRDLDVPIVNLGFSGSGVMEFEMSEHLAAIDASCYVLDCLPNMGSVKDNGGRPGRNVESNYEPFIRNLRAKRPNVPIVMAEGSDVYARGPTNKDRFIKALYAKLVAEGWTRLVYLPKDGMFEKDGEGTVDGCHPNDLGMRSMATAFGGAVREALGL